MGESEETPTWIARKLLRAARQATLATQASGQPFAGLVTPATTADADPLLLLSDLSEHTRHLRADARCALLVVGEAVEANPQTAPRVTLLGEAVIDPDPAARARFLAVHPYAALYAGFGDFNIWRIRPRSAAFVGGFARAFRLSAAQLSPDPAAVSALSEAHADIVEHCNHAHAEAMAALAGSASAIMVGVDTDGCDLLPGGNRSGSQESRDPQAAGLTLRVAWDHPARTPDDVRRELIRLARAARMPAPPTPDAKRDR